MERVVITGASGLVGSSVLKLLDSRGIETLVVTRRRTKLSNQLLNMSSRIKFLEVPDAFDKENLGWIPKEYLKAAEGAIFFNFAWGGKTRVSTGDLTLQFRNVTLATDFLLLASRIGCIKFVNSGSLEETFLELYLSSPKIHPASPQPNYSLAKITTRDMCKALAYFEKIDYVHTRMSVPLPRDLSSNSFVSKSLSQILRGLSYEIPSNNRIVDIVSVDEVAEAFLAIGSYGQNNADYYIGSSTPATLAQYFAWLEKSLVYPQKPDFVLDSDELSHIFDTRPLERDTGLRPLTNFPNLVAGLKVT